jgi:hypothetical protein
MTAEEFKLVLAALANELVDANIHFKLRTDLIKAHDEFAGVFRQTPGFWSLTLQALLDAAVFRLCKVYDTDTRTVSLPNFVRMVKTNQHVFEEKNFRERLKGNPFVDALAADARAPDPRQLAEDLIYVDAKTNPTVQVLVDLRNNYYAHRNARDVIESADLRIKYPLTLDDVAKLLADGVDIANRYSSLFDASRYSIKMIGHDDYTFLLSTMQADLKRRDAEMDEELRRLGI